MSKIITINNVELPLVEYRGQRVVTLAMIDSAHKRPEGTARRNFNANRARFIEGEDFAELTADEIRTQSLTSVFPARTSSGTIITESGYLMLVKSFTDDLAWDVQRALVNGYFRGRALAASLKKPAVAGVLPGPAREFRAAHGIAKLIGLKGNQAALAANKATARITGVDFLHTLGADKLEDESQDPRLTVTQLGVRLNLRAQDVNNLLIERGYQTRTRTPKGRYVYEPTERGSRYAVLVDMDKAKQAGKPIQGWEWKASILPHLALAAGGRAAA